MERLTKAGLYGEGLVSVYAKEVRDRYNACLEDIGLARTELERFSIDGSGWSPEISYEKNDPGYLGQSETNRVAIVISPDQKGKPLYQPMFSFERDMLDRYFEANLEQVADITTDAALWIEFDQGLSQFRSPLDLLLIDRFDVRTHLIGGVSGEADQQRALCQRFLSNGEAWFSELLREQIIESARKCGDLRQRRVGITDMVFSDTRHFHCRALGGVFVFRGLKNRENLLITEDPEAAREEPPQGTELLSIMNPAWLKTLRDEGIVQTDLKVFKQRPDELAYLQECLLADAVSKVDPEAPLEKMTAARKKTLVHRHRREMPAEYFELERLGKILERPGSMRVIRVEPDVEVFLSYPSPDLPQQVQALVWQLLCKVCPVDVAKLYLYDKAQFYEEYQHWPENKRRWAVGAIQRRLRRSR
jgi:hypothetical protein